MTLKILCARSMTTAVNALAAKFTRASGQELDITFATVGALQARVAGGERADILILGAPAIAKMEQAGAIVPGSRKDIARTSIGIAVRSDAPVPDVSTAEAFKQTLGAARVIAFSDAAVGGSAGVHLAQLWGRMGMADEIKRKAMPQKSGGEVATRVAEGEADIGLTLIAEIVPIPGVRVVGKIPAPLGNDTTTPPAYPPIAQIRRRPPPSLPRWRGPPSATPGPRRVSSCRDDSGRIRINDCLAVTFCHGCFAYRLDRANGFLARRRFTLPGR